MNASRLLAVISKATPLLLAVGAQAQNRFPVPPPPPPTYHPNAGPFAVRLDEQGGIASDQNGVIENAWASWRGPKLESFMLCYFETGSGRTNWTSALRGLDNVAAELKAHGATSVVFLPTRICDTPAASLRSSGSYVQILGVLRG